MYCWDINPEPLFWLCAILGVMLGFCLGNIVGWLQWGRKKRRKHD
jgi:hypothetical protein